MIDIRQVESIYKLDFSLERLATTDEEEQEEGGVRGERYALSWRRKVWESRRLEQSNCVIT